MIAKAKASATAETPHTVELMPLPRRVRAVFNGVTVADSERVTLVRETGHRPVYYFPPEDIRNDLLRPSEHHSHCPYKGDAAYWTLTVDGRAAENAVWSYPDPIDDVAGLRGLMAFYWDRVDAWYEEDEEVFVHPRDPKVRLDVLDSSRRVRVILGGETLADTRRARFLFETGLRTRYYIPREDVRMERLEPSPSHTRCPYKGTASYWSVRIGDEVYKDVVWSYPDPLPETARIKGYFAFYDEKVDAVTVEPVPAIGAGQP